MAGIINVGSTAIVVPDATATLPTGAVVNNAGGTFGGTPLAGANASSELTQVPVGKTTSFAISSDELGITGLSAVSWVYLNTDPSIKLTVGLPGVSVEPAVLPFYITVEITPTVDGTFETDVAIAAQTFFVYKLRYTTGVPIPPPPPAPPVLALPVPISVTAFDPGPPGDSYTKIFNDTMLNYATADDGYDATAAVAGALSDALQADAAALAVVDPIITALGAASSFDTLNLDGSLAGYDALKPTSDGVLVNVGGAAPPDVLELPINPDFGSGPAPVPIQTSVDLGTFHLGDAVPNYLLGTIINDNGQWFGLYDATLADGNPAIFTIVDVTTNVTDTLTWDTLSLVVTTAIVGQWTAQVNLTESRTNQMTILTLTVTVIP